MSIEDEAAELRNAQRVASEIGPHVRCHICGQPKPKLRRYDTHINGGAERWACENCYPVPPDVTE